MTLGKALVVLAAARAALRPLSRSQGVKRALPRPKEAKTPPASPSQPPSAHLRLSPAVAAVALRVPAAVRAAAMRGGGGGGGRAGRAAGGRPGGLGAEPLARRLPLSVVVGAQQPLLRHPAARHRERREQHPQLPARLRSAPALLRASPQLRAAARGALLRG